MRATEEFGEEEISLLDLWERLREGWRWVFGGLLIGLLGAAAALAIITPQYEAIAVLQTGKVAGVVIEEASTVVERLKSQSFLLEVAREVGDQGWIDAINDGGGKKVLTALIPKTTPGMIEVKVMAGSPDAARKIADDATMKIIQRQKDISAQMIAKIYFDIAVVKEKLVKAEQDLLMLSKTISSTTVNNERFSQISLLTSLKLQKESDTFSLRQSVYSLENSLLPPSTQSARVLEDIFVSRKAVSPKKGLLLALGLVSGLLGGVMWVFVSGAWRQARALRQSGAAR